MYAHVGLKNRTQLHTSIRHIDKKKVNFRQEFFSLSVPNQQGESKRPNQPVFQDFSLYGLLSPLGRVSILGPTSIYTLYSQPAGPLSTQDYFFLSSQLFKKETFNFEQAQSIAVYHAIYCYALCLFPREYFYSVIF